MPSTNTKLSLALSDTMAITNLNSSIRLISPDDDTCFNLHKRAADYTHWFIISPDNKDIKSFDFMLSIGIRYPVSVDWGESIRVFAIAHHQTNHLHQSYDLPLTMVHVCNRSPALQPQFNENLAVGFYHL